MLLVLLNTFSAQYEFDFSAIYRADSAGSRILSFVENIFMRVFRYEPRHEKTGFWPRRKQRRISASQ